MESIIIVNIYAQGSLLPLSTSNNDAVPYFNDKFLLFNIENTDAASVQLITEPINKLSKRGIFNTI